MIIFYADKECTKQLKGMIEWDNNFVMTTVNGEKITIKNTVASGEMATATVYIKNESKWRYVITKIEVSDNRIKCKVETGILLSSPVKMMLTYKAPDNPSPSDVIESGIIKIKGYYIYGE